MRRGHGRRRQSDLMERLLRRRRWTRRAIITALVILALSFVLDRLGYFNFDGDDWKQFDQQKWFVSHVVDGDTLVVRDAIGRETHVRLIGVDAPEMHRDGSAPPDHWANRSTAYLEARVEGRNVVLKLEATQTRDKYDRLLAYIYESDTKNMNEILVRDGQAYADRRFPHTLSGQFEVAETQARKKQIGLWRDLKTEQMPAWRQEWLKRQAERRVADFR